MGKMEIEVNNTKEDSRAYLIKMTSDRTSLKTTKQGMAVSGCMSQDTLVTW